MPKKGFKQVRKQIEERRCKKCGQFKGQKHICNESSWIKGLTKETDPQVAKIADALRGRYVSKETKRKIRETKKKGWKEGKYCQDREKNPNWKGGRHKDVKGYVHIRKPEHPYANGCYVFEHRLIMEKWLRENEPDSKYLVEVNGEKYLDPKTVVHHINGIRDDNKIENLHLFSSKSKHIEFHYYNGDFSISGSPKKIGKK